MTRRAQTWLVAGAGVLAALGLLLPWARTGTRGRSSLDLVSSAGALDVLSGTEVTVLLLGWFAVVVAAALGLVLVAWERPGPGLVASALVGPALLVAFAAVAVSPLAVAWGAWIASGLGVAASIGSGLLLTRVSQREGTAT